MPGDKGVFGAALWKPEDWRKLRDEVQLALTNPPLPEE